MEGNDEPDAGGKRQRGATGESVAAPSFPQVSAREVSGGKAEFRRIAVPSHRYTPLRKDWMQIYTPIVEHLKLDVRMNPRNRAVELKTSAHTDDIDALQKAADFVRAYVLGFEIGDAVALLRVEDLFVDTFQVTDVKILKGDHLSRAIGRIAGKDGKCKFTIENATKTRIVLAENRGAPRPALRPPGPPSRPPALPLTRRSRRSRRAVHILGSFANIKTARDAICSLIMGSPISKVYTNLRTHSARIGHRL